MNIADFTFIYKNSTVKFADWFELDD